MSLHELEDAIARLSPDELSQLVDWLGEYQRKLWEKQLEQDIGSEYFDSVLKEIDEFKAEMAL